MLVLLSAIVSDQASLTDETMIKTRHFLDYVALHPDVILTFNGSSMVLNVHSDASYLCEPKVRSIVGGHFFHVRQPRWPKKQRRGIDSRANFEIGGVFGRRGGNRCTFHIFATGDSRTNDRWGNGPRPTANANSNGQYHRTLFRVKNLKPKATKSTDMKFWWMRAQTDQQQFRYH